MNGVPLKFSFKNTHRSRLSWGMSLILYSRPSDQTAEAWAILSPLHLSTRYRLSFFEAVRNFIWDQLTFTLGSSRECRDSSDIGGWSCDQWQAEANPRPQPRWRTTEDTPQPSEQRWNHNRTSDSRSCSSCKDIRCLQNCNDGQTHGPNNW